MVAVLTSRRQLQTLQSPLGQRLLTLGNAMLKSRRRAAGPPADFTPLGDVLRDGHEVPFSDPRLAEIYALVAVDDELARRMLGPASETALAALHEVAGSSEGELSMFVVYLGQSNLRVLFAERLVSPEILPSVVDLGVALARGVADHRA